MSSIKASVYNRYLQRDGNWFVINCRTQAVLQLSPDTHRLMTDGDCRSISDLELELLQEHGIIVPSCTDERELILELNQLMRSRPSLAGICMVPTMACNLACDYCYQGQKHPSIGPTISIDALQCGLTNYLWDLCERHGTIESLQVNWYGGEPLLCLDRVTLLSHWFAEQANSLGISLELSMITNGYLLDHRTARQLADLNWRWLQITLDGARQIHDQRRRHHVTGGTFDRIVQHIADMAEYPDIRIALRVNVDRNNADTIPVMLDELRCAGLSEMDNVGLYFAPVRAAGQVCLTDTGCFVSVAHFGDMESEFISQARAIGFQASIQPLTRIAGCSATSPAVIVVGPQGQIHKCVGSLMDDNLAVGQLTSAGIQITDQALNDAWNTWIPDEKCQQCSVLPVCMGGCAMEDVLREVNYTSDIALVAGEERCTHWLHSGDRLLAHYLDTLIESEEGS